jgi:hypothetical protein
MTMEEGILDIELVHRPRVRESQAEDDSDSSRLHNRAESFIIINTRTLSKTAQDPSSLVTIKSTICQELVPKNPFTSNNVDAGRLRH